MRSARRVLSGTHVTLVVALLVSSLAAAPAPQSDAVRLDNTFFDWVDVLDELATFEWSADVVNNSQEPLRLRIILEVLDDDDRVVNRDEQGNPTDAVIITVDPGQIVPVKQEGALSYDRAAEVVTYRHRWEIIQGDA